MHDYLIWILWCFVKIMVRVLGYRSAGQGSIPGITRRKK
jgi:hypothetical protein